MIWIPFFFAELLLISGALLLDSLHYKWSMPTDEYEWMLRQEKPEAYGL